MISSKNKKKRGYLRWNKKQDEFLKSKYPIYGNLYCSKKLKRTKNSIQNRAKFLKLKKTKNKRVAWFPEEIDIIKKFYAKLGPDKTCAMLKDRTKAATKYKAADLGVKVNRDFYNNHNLNLEDLSHFIDIKNPFIAYLLGFIWADGNVSKKSNMTKLAIAEEDFNNFKGLLLKTAKSWKICGYRVSKKHKKMICAAINNKQLKKFLVENDYLIKSGASADKILSKIPENLKHYWWRGYFDGDGCFYFRKERGSKHISIASCFNQNWSFANKLSKFLNIKIKIRRNKRKMGKNSTITFASDSYIRRFCEYIYSGETFGLKRKYKKYLDYLRYRNKISTKKNTIYRGVTKKINRYILQIEHKGKHHKKSFIDIIEAAKEYDRLALKYFGSKARLNFPEDYKMVNYRTISEKNLTKKRIRNKVNIQIIKL